jgi:hypothetical protein
MRRRPMLPLLLACLATPPNRPARAMPDRDDSLDLAALMIRMSAVKERHESFREVRRLAALEFPLILTGTLHYWRPARLEKRTESPERETLMVDGDRVELTLGNEPTQHLDLARAPELRVLVDAFRAPLAGDLAALRRSFQVEVTGTPEAWLLVLQPIEQWAARMLREIRLGGVDAAVRETVWLQANGDEHRMLTKPLP